MRNVTSFRTVLASLVILASLVGSVFAQAAPQNKGGPANNQAKGFKPTKLDTSGIKNKFLAISYETKSATQKLDIFLPNEGKGPFPVIISIHGGGFIIGSRDGGEMAPILSATNAGYAVVFVDYRLSTEARFPAAIADVKSAIRYIRKNAAKYQLNPDKIALWGGSSGGNLVSLAGTSGKSTALNGDATSNLDTPATVTAVVDWFGPLNFLKMDEDFASIGIKSLMVTASPNSAESRYIGGDIRQYPDLVKASNPETYIDANSPPFFIQHGDADPNVPYVQSQRFAQELATAIGKDKVVFELIKGAGHGGPQFDNPENVKKVIAFLDKYMK